LDIIIAIFLNIDWPGGRLVANNPDGQDDIYNFEMLQ
jgi:hypothetical protein